MLWGRKNREINMLEKWMHVMTSDTKNIEEYAKKIDTNVYQLQKELQRYNASQNDEVCKYMGQVDGRLTEIDKELQVIHTIIENIKGACSGETKTQNYRSENYETYTNDLYKMIEGLCTNNQIKTQEICEQIKQICSLNNAELRQLNSGGKTDEIDNAAVFRVIVELKAEFEKEKVQNRNLEKLIEEQSKQISILTKKIDTIANDNERKIHENGESIENMQQSFSKTEELSNKVVVEKDIPVLTENYLHNLRYLENCYNNITELKEGYFSILGEDCTEDIYFKILGKYEEELKDLLKKIKEDDEIEPDDIAKDLIDIIKSTIIKCFSNTALVECIDKYLCKCKFRKVCIETGKKMNNDLYKYIEQPLQKQVNKAELNNVVISKKHDAYYICYKDDENISRKVILSECEIGVYNNISGLGD